MPAMVGGLRRPAGALTVKVAVRSRAVDGARARIG
jgi:hypothetical protein